ncbi:beta-ketoacyl synthase N-terminal-like domain-containing protein [Crossiella sp. CA-258035]|uniref:beta-ketoacyl synthase N-terminal-like domain-containing protein n=1 Tax=Crossiella sp. CA-258035 TaxID=2981138 RepID=UPI0024BD05CA|nr:beta-ketoacyl synthase N-terminal-like domain-containing protein [Crossiella sp. CA-258035]WHT18869.1 beta-ketoacyl synthase N-terminal-like domain-containing protein [Crossiella sp. CA-258035]
MTGLALTAHAAASAFGLRTATLLTGLREGRPPAGFAVPDLDIQGELGLKGTASMDRAAALAVLTVGELLAAHPGLAEEDTALVLGTTSGSAHTQANVVRGSLTRRRPYFIEPSLVPFALMNGPASICAIRHGLRGPNATVAGGRAAVLTALRYASRLVQGGQCARALVGGTEELTPERAWLEGQYPVAAGPLGEGAGVLLLEPPGQRPVLAEVLGFGSVVGGVRDAAADCVRRLLARHRVDPAEVAVVSAPAVVSGLFPSAAAVDPAALLGDTGAAAGLFQLIGVLTAGRTGPAVVVSADQDHSVVAALLRLP